MLQLMCDVIQQLLRGGLTSTNLLQTFVTHRIPPPHQREMNKLMYPGPSCPNRPFSVELNGVEINTRIRGVLAHAVDPNFGSGLVSLL
jgi:hypothetical protein